MPMVMVLNVMQISLDCLFVTSSGNRHNIIVLQTENVQRENSDSVMNKHLGPVLLYIKEVLTSHDSGDSCAFAEDVPLDYDDSTSSFLSYHMPLRYGNVAKMKRQWPCDAEIEKTFDCTLEVLISWQE